MLHYRMRRQELARLVVLSAQVARHDGQEICGLLVDNGFLIEPVLLDNKIRRGGGFAFYVKQVREVQTSVKALGYEIVGTFHSHPAYVARPGDSDIAGAPDDSLMLIIDVREKAYALWRILNGQAERLRLKPVPGERRKLRTIGKTSK